jgi:hypothetical protein
MKALRYGAAECAIRAESDIERIGKLFITPESPAAY